MGTKQTRESETEDNGSNPTTCNQRKPHRAKRHAPYQEGTAERAAKHRVVRARLGVTLRTPRATANQARTPPRSRYASLIDAHPDLAGGAIAPQALRGSRREQDQSSPRHGVPWSAAAQHPPGGDGSAASPSRQRAPCPTPSAHFRARPGLGDSKSRNQTPPGTFTPSPHTPNGTSTQPPRPRLGLNFSVTQPTQEVAVWRACKIRGSPSPLACGLRRWSAR